jgi:hypothetical protein
MTVSVGWLGTCLALRHLRHRGARIPRGVTPRCTVFGCAAACFDPTIPRPPNQHEQENGDSQRPAWTVAVLLAFVLASALVNRADYEVNAWQSREWTHTASR